MNSALSVIVGLVWGGLFGLLSAFITKKIASGDEKKIPSLALVRMLIDAFALAAVYFTRKLLPLRFEITLISAAIALSLVSIVAAYHTAAKMK